MLAGRRAKRGDDRETAAGRGVSPRVAYSYLAPGGSVYAVLFLLPVGVAAWLSFRDWGGLGPIGESDWVGFDNYAALLGDSIFWGALWHTAVFAVVTTVGQTVLALFIAFTLWYYRPWGEKVRRLVIIVPMVLSMVLVGLIWKQILSIDGPFNSVLRITVSWFGNPDIVLLPVMWMTIWQWTGWSMLLFYAGLVGMPRNVIRAAKIDGASDRQLFWHVIRPMLRRTTGLVIILNVIGVAQAFDTIWVTTRGGPLHASQTLVTYAHWLVFDPGGPRSFGMATAVSLIGVTILMVFAVLYFRAIERAEQ